MPPSRSSSEPPAFSDAPESLPDLRVDVDPPAADRQRADQVTDDFPLEEDTKPSVRPILDDHNATGPYHLIASVALGQRDSAAGYMAPATMASAGAVLGSALGDALGLPAMHIGSRELIREAYPPDGVSSFELFSERDGERFAPYTSETQQAEIVLRTLVATRDRMCALEPTMELVARGLVDWAARCESERYPSNTCLSACAALERGVHWSGSGEKDSSGSGSLVRAYPFGLRFRAEPRQAEEWARAQCRLTHGAPSAIASSAAVAVGVAHAARGDTIEVAISEMVAAACRVDPKCAALMADAYAESLGPAATEHILDRLTGWSAVECVSAVVFLWSRHRDDPRAGLLEAANSPGKSNTIAALLGALMGAHVGISALDPTWLLALERGEALMVLARRL